jgi:MATE family multidrug resistance protein
MGFPGAFLRKHFDGDGGINALLPLALPMVIVQSFDTVMMFVGRLFMGQLGPEYIAASMSGGLTSFLVSTFFLGLVNYVGTLTAHAWGAKRGKDCPRIIGQGILLGLLAWPLILGFSFLVVRLFTATGHDPAQVREETRYFWILVIGSIFTLLRSALAGFFVGISRPRIIVWANLAALVTTVGLSWLLIFGKWGCPELKTTGGALAVVAGSAAMCAVLAGAFWWELRKPEFAGARFSLRPDLAILRRLFRFGGPSGIEFFLNLAAFTLVVALLHGYGKETAAAVSIVFSWDLVSFIPMIGVQIGVMTLVGQYMGANHPAAAERATYSGLKLVFSYATVMMIIFLSLPHLLVGVFIPNDSHLDYSRVAPEAEAMLKFMVLYLFSDGMSLVFSGGLRGAGDTAWTMAASITIHWVMALLVWLSVKVLVLPPLATWLIFVAVVMTMGLLFMFRFRHGAWKSIRVLGDALDHPGGVA